MEDKVKKTPLFKIHESSGGKIVDFAGWALPVQYKSVIEEHRNTRSKASLFDTSHMGEIQIRGEEASSFLQTLITNDLGRLETGYCFYAVICNEQGKSLDDCFVYKKADDCFFIVINASNIDKIVNWVESHISGYKAVLENLSDSLGKIDIQGPESQSILESFLKESCSESEWPRFSFRKIPYNSGSLLISRSGYTGEDGFEFYMNADKAPEIWEKLMELGKKKGLAPAGLGSRDSLRLESCYSLYGHELDEESTPVESGLGWVVRKKDSDYFGKEILLKQKEEGVFRSMIAFEMTERAIPRHACPLLIDKGNGETFEAGIVTSGGFSPTFEKNIGLGFIDRKYNSPGTDILVDIRGRLKKAVIVKRPFYNFRGK